MKPRVGTAHRLVSSFARCLPRIAAAACFLVATSCAPRARVVSVSIQTLEDGQIVPPNATLRAIVADPGALSDLARPLCKRISLIEIRTTEQWQRLRRAAPEIGDCPDLSRGIVVGVLSRAGMPLDGEWPLSLETVHLADGAGYVRADFHGGTYLPDGTTYLELAQVPRLRNVLMVDVNGVRFYP